MIVGSMFRVALTRVLYFAVSASMLWVVNSVNAQIYEWKVADGGNGHAYTILSNPPETQPMNWWQARSIAEEAGGHLATFSNRAEAEWVFDNVVNHAWVFPTPAGPWIGALHDGLTTIRPQPGQGWRWIDGTPWNWAPWDDGLCAAPVSQCNKGPEDALLFSNPQCLASPSQSWACAEPYGACTPCDDQVLTYYALVEYDMDCNQNGVNDRIELQFSLAPDRNDNLVPDECECLADINLDGSIDEHDLSILIGNWGEFGIGDLDDDGIVGQSDLMLLYEFWGPCVYCSVC
jgi:Lectin C-type domain